MAPPHWMLPTGDDDASSSYGTTSSAASDSGDPEPPRGAAPKGRPATAPAPAKRR
jgi:hypothetical protein